MHERTNHAVRLKFPVALHRARPAREKSIRSHRMSRDTRTVLSSKTLGLLSAYSTPENFIWGEGGISHSRYPENSLRFAGPKDRMSHISASRGLADIQCQQSSSRDFELFLHMNNVYLMEEFTLSCQNHYLLG